MARILVTGAAGFIGSHLSDYLDRQGHDVIATDVRPQPPVIAHLAWYLCDLTDAGAVTRLLEDSRPTVIMHLGARTDLEETKDLTGYDANIAGVANLANAIAQVGGVERAVCTSSQLVCRIGYSPAHDEDYQPSTLYGESKVQTERIWRAKDGGAVLWCIVRPTTVWGPRMNPHYLRFFGMVKRGRYRHLGGGPRLKSYSYVGNIVRQYASLVDAAPKDIARRVFYFADYHPLALEAWADAFAVAFKAPKIPTIPLWVAQAGARLGDLLNLAGAHAFPFNSFRLRNVISEYRADTRPIESICSELPFSMADGVAATAEWVEHVWATERNAREPRR